MRFILILLLLLPVYQCFSDPILDKLTEIDNQMNNGKVEYIMKGNDKKVGTQKIIFSYLESGIYKKEISFESGRSITVYNDGKDIVRVSENGITLDKKSDSDRANPYSDVLPKASCVYGRGLTRLNNVTIKNNILKGDEYGYFVKAYLDPNYDYLCYKLEVISPKGLIIDTLTNKKPVLVDNKYYIYTESSRKNILKELNKDITINSITFVPPNKKDIEFDWKKSSLNVVDTRVNDYAIGYKRESLSNDITSEKLLKNTKKNVNDIYSNIGIKKTDDTRNKIMILCISVLLFILVLSFFIYTIKKKK